jgi:hypothetical protein
MRHSLGLFLMMTVLVAGPTVARSETVGGLSIKSAANYFATARRVGMRVALGLSRGSGLAITR